MSWAAAGTIWAKGASFAAQIVLGYLLTGDEWGVYAIAISVAAFVMTFRDGGVRELLVQRGESEYDNLVGPVFWIALTVNAAIAAFLAATAVVAADFYEQPEVRDLIWVLAATVILDTPAQLLRAKLRIDLRFGLYARLDIISATIRYGGAIVLATQGFGAMSFVLPLPVISVVEWALMAYLTREKLLRHRPEFARWRALLHGVKWLLLGTIAGVFATMGDYTVLGKLVPAGVVGSYYFAFQLSVHASMLAAANVNTVLMPTLVRVGSDLVRQSRATLRALAALSLIASPLSLGLTVVIDPLELLIWDGKWRSAVGAVQILGFMLPIRLSFMLATSSLKARGLFRRWAVLAVVQGLGLMATAGVTGSFTDSPTVIALVISLYWLIMSPVTLGVAIRRLATVGQIGSALAPAWLIACGCASVLLAIDSLFLAELTPPVRVLLLGLGYSVLFLTLTRLLIRSHLSDTLSVLPAKLSGPVRRLLGLANA